MRVRLICGAVLAFGTALAIPLPDARPVPGGIAILDLGPLQAPKPRAQFQGRPVLVVAEADRWNAVIGIPLATDPGSERLEVVDGAGRHLEPITVGRHDYPTQSLKVAPKQVDLSKADLTRYASEKERLQRVLGTFSDTEPPTLRFAAPVPGVRSSSFGSRRRFNGVARNPHSGMDIAAAANTIVRAPIAGRVIDRYDYFFNGLTVIVDHGGGLLTMYCHLNRADVAVNETIASGATVGLVGATGRATGPHLHFGILLNGAWVDPELMLEPR